MNVSLEVDKIEKIKTELKNLNYVKTVNEVQVFRISLGKNAISAKLACYENPTNVQIKAGKWAMRNGYTYWNFQTSCGLFKVEKKENVIFEDLRK